MSSFAMACDGNVNCSSSMSRNSEGSRLCIAVRQETQCSDRPNFISFFGFLIGEGKYVESCHGGLGASYSSRLLLVKFFWSRDLRRLLNRLF